MSAAEPGFGVYIHWPFCAAKCPYCDFNSHVRHQPPDQPRFAAALAREIATMATRAPGRTVDSIFLGGGTPSLMAPATVGAVLDAVAKHWPVSAEVEVTLEANPSSVEAERFRGGVGASDGRSHPSPKPAPLRVPVLALPQGEGWDRGDAAECFACSWSMRR